MLSWWNIYILIALCSTGFSLCYTPLCRKLAFKINLLDKPATEGHKAHDDATPLLGGLAICLSLISTLIFCIIAVKSLPQDVMIGAVKAYLPAVSKVTSRMIIIFAGAVAATALGLYDDKFAMSAKVKFSGQFIIAFLVVYFANIQILTFLNIPILSIAATVLWIVTLMNAINFFDNMDGLAIGTATIAFSLFTIVAGMQGQYFIASLSALCTGAALGFWFFNHSPATIFMGDSGSHLLGYLMAILGSMITYYDPKNGNSMYYSLLIPIFILSMPLFDLVAVTIIRLKLRKPFYIGDHNHISHRFHKMGLSRKTSVLIVHLLALTIGMGVLPILWGDMRTISVCVIQVLTVLLIISILQYSGKKEN